MNESSFPNFKTHPFFEHFPLDTGLFPSSPTLEMKLQTPDTQYLGTILRTHNPTHIYTILRNNNLQPTASNSSIESKL